VIFALSFAYARFQESRRPAVADGPGEASD
jgi:hypothetical protein